MVRSGEKFPPFSQIAVKKKEFLLRKRERLRLDFIAFVCDMGNVNAREEANSNNASVVEDDDAEICSREAMSAASDGNHVAPTELMGQSPPHSPRATQSPLMFAPQVLLVPDSLFLAVLIWRL